MTLETGGGPHGVLIVDKPSGPTSHDIVAQARRQFRTRRVGHAGTLDPMATGVLVLLFGEATKLSDVATGCDKRYAAELSFGRATESHDREGATTAELAEVPTWIDEAALGAALAAERERALQVPPTVSALKVGGKRAHQLTRMGTPPVLEPRPIRVHDMLLSSCGGGRARVELLVSKGYYVRAFARDLGAALGVPAHLSELRRLASGGFTLAEACSWPPPAGREPVPLAAILPRLVPTLRLNEAGLSRARQGQLLGAEDFLDDPTPFDGSSAPICAWTDAYGTPVALGQRDTNGFRVKRGFVPPAGSKTDEVSGA